MSGFPSPPSIFLPHSLYLSSRPGLFHFLLALSLYKTWKMFSLALADNVEMVSVENRGLPGEGWRLLLGGIVGLEPGFPSGRWNPKSQISSGTHVKVFSVFFLVGYIICCASSTGDRWPRGEITSFNQNYKSATACSCYLPSHRAPYLFSKAQRQVSLERRPIRYTAIPKQRFYMFHPETESQRS